MKNVLIFISGKLCVCVGLLKKRDCERFVKLDENFFRFLVFEGILIYDNIIIILLFLVIVE